MSSRDLIAELRRDAENRHIYAMARDIALNFGKQQRKNHGSWWNYRNGSLLIMYDDYGPNLFVEYKEQNVFGQQLHRILRYRPDIDNWIGLISRIFEEDVEPLLKAREAARASHEAKQLLENWGIKGAS